MTLGNFMPVLNLNGSAFSILSISLLLDEFLSRMEVKINCILHIYKLLQILLVSSAFQTSAICSAPATRGANWLHVNSCNSAAQAYQPHTQSLWLFLTFLDLGEIVHHRVWSPKQSPKSCMMQPRNAGEWTQKGHLDQWETLTNGKQKLKRKLGSQIPFHPLVDCSEACPSGGSLRGWAATLANQPAVLFQEAVSSKAIYHFALFLSSLASILLFLTVTALSLHLLMSSWTWARTFSICLFNIYWHNMSFSFNLIMQWMTLLHWKTCLYSWHKLYTWPVDLFASVWGSILHVIVYLECVCMCTTGYTGNMASCSGALQSLFRSHGFSSADGARQTGRWRWWRWWQQVWGELGGERVQRGR